MSCASLMFGTMSPRGVAAAMPRFTKWWTMISRSVQAEFTERFRRTAQMTAFATMSSGETLTPANVGEALSRLTNSIVWVASTSTNR